MQENSKFLINGERITLVIQGDHNGHQYTSKVEQVHEDGIIDVLIPISKSQVLYIRNDALLKVIVVRDSAIFEFKAKIADKLFGVVPLLRLQMVSDVIKIQRRNYYRLKVVKPIKVRRAISFKEKLFEEYFNSSLVDLSGGGIGFTSSVELSENDIVEINMELNSNPLKILSRIVRKGFLDNNKYGMYLYGAHFEKITEIERNHIMRYIFEEQRKLAKKGLI